MKFVETVLAGAYVLELERLEDERGFFARTWCAVEFAAHGLDGEIAQCNLSSNQRRGTLRGMHYQAAPHQEAKVVRCIRGAIYDVIVDLRHDSPTLRRWTSVELSADNKLALYVPKDFAHGFQTMTDDAEVFYEMSTPYAVGFGRGVRWNDPALAIEWPIGDPILSDRDRTYPDLT